jgi:hypothetical protein
MRMLILALPLALLSTVAAVPGQAQEMSCQNAQFSETVMQRFPRVRAACLEVIRRDSVYFAVFKADLVRVTQSGVRIRPKLPDGSHAETRHVDVSPDRRVLVEGEQFRFDELSLPQELTVYIQVTEPMVALSPVNDIEPWALSSLQNVEPARTASADTPVAMPDTSSVLPYVGLCSGALLCLGAVLRRVRRSHLHGRAETR